MAIVIGDHTSLQMSQEAVADWRGIPTAVISDELNRSCSMSALIKAIRGDWTIVGPAMTAQVMPADNLALHHAVAMAPAGVVLVVDAGGYDRNAVWGGILHRAAELRGLAGIVIDGAVRDVRELQSSMLPCFASGIVPGGPHKGWGGSINLPIQAGGCAVSPGDLVVGDADGVVVVPASKIDGLLDTCRRRIATELNVIRQLEAGLSTVEIFGLAGL